MAGTSEAIIGLVGVVVGGGITTAGTLWAQRAQLRAGIATERRAREMAASTTALTTVSALVQMGGQPEGGPAADWLRRRADLLAVLGTAAVDLGSYQLRERVGEVHFILDFHAAATSLTGQAETATRSIACGHALACLGAFRRGEPLPERPAGYTATINAIKEWLSARESTDR